PGRLQQGLRRGRSAAGDDELEAVRVPRGDQLAGRARGDRSFGAGVLQLREQPVAGLRRLLAGGRQLQPRGRLPAAAKLPAAVIPRVLSTAAEAVAVD